MVTRFIKSNIALVCLCCVGDFARRCQGLSPIRHHRRGSFLPRVREGFLARAVVSRLMLLTTRKLLQVPLFLCLVYNPMVLDYLVAARGYSLAMGFLLAAIVVIARAMLADGLVEQPGFRGTCVAASVLLALSFSATFSFSFVDAATMLLFFWWAAARRREAGRRIRLAISCFLPGIVVAFVICGYTLWGYPKPGRSRSLKCGTACSFCLNRRASWRHLIESCVWYTGSANRAP
jgi:hypothetical protein